jgi:DNA-binding MarR family transcriptional regulator
MLAHANFIASTVGTLTIRVAMSDLTAPESAVLETHDGLKYFAPARSSAWIGILRAHAELTRGLDAELQAKHGVTLSAYEILSRLAHAEGGQLPMTQLAEQAKLSVSRVSRLMDHLHGRTLASRRACGSDSRIVYATIEPAGRDLVRAAQETFFAIVNDRFFGRLSCDEVATLGSLLDRLVDPGAAAC